jgi:hypothetical protein
MRDTRFKVATKLPLFQTESPFWKPSIKITIATYLHEPSRTTYRTQLIEVQGVQLEHTKRSSWMKGLSELFQRDVRSCTVDNASASLIIFNPL